MAASGQNHTENDQMRPKFHHTQGDAELREAARQAQSQAPPTKNDEEGHARAGRREPTRNTALSGRPSNCRPTVRPTAGRPSGQPA